MSPQISGKEATYVALEANARKPIALEPPPAGVVPAIASRGDCGQNDPSSASARGATSDSSAEIAPIMTGANDRRATSRDFSCRAYGAPYVFV